jgi:hypothetical protein
MNRFAAKLLFVLVPFAGLHFDALAEQRASTARSIAGSPEIEQLAQGMEQECLRRKPPTNGLPAIAQALISVQNEPQLCACVASLIRTDMKPDMILKSDEQLSSYIKNLMLTKSPQCLVPALKKRLTDSCERIFESSVQETPPEVMQQRLADRGYSSMKEFTSEFCGCLRPRIRLITTKEWVDSSSAAYNDYLQRKRTGQSGNSEASDPFETAFKACMPKAR